MPRYKTWQDECLPRMDIRGTGPVALCVLWNLIETVTEHLPAGLSELGTVGNLRTPLGISWFLRGLYQLPHIKKVVVWGSDLTGSGQALLNLWARGAAEGHTVPEQAWALDKLVPAEAIDILRREVQLVDLRGKPRGSILAELGFDGDRTAREKVEFPPVEVPERQFWSARGTAIHIEASGPAHGWLGALSVITRCGIPKDTRKGEKLAHFFDVVISFPVPETETVDPCFDFTGQDLEQYASQVLSPVRPEGVDYWYGERIQNWRGHNQLEELIARMAKQPDTKRGTMALLEAPDIEELEDAPCFALSTFSIRDGVLDGSFVFRSHDMYQGWPFNIFSILRLHRLVADRLGYRYGRATFHSQHAQIYERYWGPALEKLDKYGANLTRPGEFLKFVADSAGNFVFTPDFQAGTIVCEYMNSTHDQVIFQVEHRDPAVLVSWLVASMPWLSPQHIRYLGVEEEKLRRFMRGDGGGYVQG